tara:strand:+ start:183 stop:371 length:189 start_codon:yes stop_codon:yes gene_type:complete
MLSWSKWIILVMLAFKGANPHIGLSTLKAVKLNKFLMSITCRKSMLRLKSSNLRPFIPKESR